MADAPQGTDAEAWRRGEQRREAAGRSGHAAWSPGEGRDPIGILEAQGRQRIAHLLPLRHARMAVDPFAFLRGAAAVMAADLARTPASGITVQSCGDCHLSNFGTFPSPEGTPVFDLNDFDETLRAPFEWDVKRLAASLAVRGAVAGLPEAKRRRIAMSAVTAYRTQMLGYARRDPFAVWSTQIDLKEAIAGIDDDKLHRRVDKQRQRLAANRSEQLGLAERRDGAWRLRPPKASDHRTYRMTEAEAGTTHAALAAYAAHLPPERALLLARYRLREVMFKVVGVGSVGTFCAVALFVSGNDAPLLLQIKEAQQSVLAPYAGGEGGASQGANQGANQGERVITGQRILQSAPDVFLGYPPERIDGRFFYVRHLKNARLAVIGEEIAGALPFYAVLCGQALARAHARAGEAAELAGYLGESGKFDAAVAEFALAYAAQTATDYESFTRAIADGRIVAAA